MACGFVADGTDDLGPCPRPERDGGELCPLHAGAAADGDVSVPAAAVWAAVCADLRSDDERRLVYAGAVVETLDLSGLAVETDGIGAVRFVDSTVAGTVDLSGSAVEQPVVFEGCTLGRLDASDLTDPKLEPELALRLGAPLDPPVTPADVLAAADAVVPVIEVVDSRIAGWELTTGSAVADNALAARVVLGGRIGDPADLDLALEGVVVRRNGERVATGVGADVLGSPARVVAWLVDTLTERDERLVAGDLISTGSLTELIPFEPGDTVEARFASLGSVTVARE